MATKRRSAHAKAPGSVQYRVVELSTVDEASLERALNEGARDGWSLDGIQFAMRESSRRPSMAFVVLVRAGDPGQVLSRASVPAPSLAPRSRGAATQRLIELAGGLDDEEP